jgi:hypothetical protein
MSKAPGIGKCVHCLTEPVKRNWDHVFPVSWYPDSTPPNLEKWQVPSCIPCNSKYGKLESDFLSHIGLCLNASNVASKSIVEAALRSMKPQAGRNEHDAQRRLKKGRKILSETLQGDKIPDHGHFPGLGNRWNACGEEPVAILMPAESFELMTMKIVRGLFYIEDGKFIEPPYKIEFFVLDDDGARPVKGVLDKFGKIYAREPGIVVHRAVAPEDGISSLFELTFWRQFKTYASVTA